MERSVAVEARIEVSTWLNDTLDIVSTEVGQWRVCSGAFEGRFRSYMETTLEETAKFGNDRWWDMLVKGVCPR